MKSKLLWCSENDDRKNICDGSKFDCITKANAFRQREWECHGFMWNDRWGLSNKGVKVCLSNELTTKPEKDWTVYRKHCKNAGNRFNANFKIESLKSSCRF